MTPPPRCPLQKERRLLENRRLDLDICKARVKKAKQAEAKAAVSSTRVWPAWGGGEGPQARTPTSGRAADASAAAAQADAWPLIRPPGRCTLTLALFSSVSS